MVFSSRKSDAAEEVRDALAKARVEDLTDGNELEVQRGRRVQAMSMAMAGFTWEAIGDHLGISETQARRLVQTALSKAENKNVEEQRALENARLDRAQQAIWSRVLQGDDKAIGTYLRIMGERAKINGMYAPTKIALSVGIQQEMEEALTNLEMLVAATPEIVEGEIVDYYNEHGVIPDTDDPDPGAEDEGTDFFESVPDRDSYPRTPPTFTSADEYGEDGLTGDERGIR